MPLGPERAGLLSRRLGGNKRGSNTVIEIVVEKLTNFHTADVTHTHRVNMYMHVIYLSVSDCACGFTNEGISGVDD